MMMNKTTHESTKVTSWNQSAAVMNDQDAKNPETDRRDGETGSGFRGAAARRSDAGPRDGNVSARSHLLSESHSHQTGRKKQNSIIKKKHFIII